jgi:hypothetical protein
MSLPKLIFVWLLISAVCLYFILGIRSWLSGEIDEDDDPDAGRGMS